jgi:hypothetical protein
MCRHENLFKLHKLRYTQKYKKLTAFLRHSTALNGNIFPYDYLLIVAVYSLQYHPDLG